jgi:hypothetical protein
MLIIGTYAAYLAISVAMTVWVARTLSTNGRIFLVDSFGGNAPLADSVNHLLVVGFYLINVGYVTLALKYGDKPESLQQAVEFLSTKIGLVAIVLGAMHFFNMYVISKIRHEVMRKKDHAPRTAKEDPMDRVMERAGA